ncbi:MAG TPA: nucleotidyl transferase AbiEii/AbiGii toxin family protein [Gammaproteobacteria bacterium]|nr:nucleotidyl transferase AbiEii/AbiGii toxin family protein [Gammaproteobacteria bacterium]
MPKNMAASVRRRLRDLARTRHEDFDYVLRQYVMQRLLYRLSCSDFSEQFLLKGALLFWVWNEDFHRPTRDIDLLSFGDNGVPHLVDVFRQIVSANNDDGLVFDVDSVNGIEIKEGADYPGVRLTGFVNLAKARIPFQVDIGYGDAVSPEPEEAQLPSFLDFPSPQLRVYPVYAVIAEKFQAMVMLGIANSRMKDFYDIKTIASTMALDGQILSDAIKATFERRKTDITNEALYVFSDEFKQDKDKQTQWAAFLNKNGLEKGSLFSGVVGEIQQFLDPIYHAIAEQRSYKQQWLADSFQWKDE